MNRTLYLATSLEDSKLLTLWIQVGLLGENLHKFVVVYHCQLESIARQLENVHCFKFLGQLVRSCYNNIGALPGKGCFLNSVESS